MSQKYFAKNNPSLFTWFRALPIPLLQYILCLVQTNDVSLNHHCWCRFVLACLLAWICPFIFFKVKNEACKLLAYNAPHLSHNKPIIYTSNLINLIYEHICECGRTLCKQACKYTQNIMQIVCHDSILYKWWTTQQQKSYKQKN